jgi:signal transduction histidine kinase
MRLEPAPSDDPLLSVAPQARRRREREQWQRRRRLERQLHDGAALRASALALQLGLFQHRVPEAERELRTAIGALQDELHAVLQELRDVAAQIYPPLLDEAGLGPALRELAERRDLPVRVRDDGGRFGAAAEGAVYFALVEALGSDTGPLEVTVRGEDGTLVATVRGAGPAVRELLTDRARPLGGTVRTVDPAAGSGPDTIVARIPCE